MLKKILTFACVALIGVQAAEACTGIVRKANNGDIVFARTLEFGANVIPFKLSYVPRGISYTGSTPSGKPGLQWNTKYAHVGFTPYDLKIMIDGVNEKGLASGGFYFPGWADYQKVSPQDSNVISNLDFVSYLLGNFATVKEVREALKNVKVAGVMFSAWGIVPGIHYIVVDASGDRIVVEYVKGELNVYEAPLDTITNAPTYAWHSTNARNYIGLKALNQPSISINGDELSSFGQGSGALGLPGDFTPPSRFIRASFFRATVLPGKNNLEEIVIAFKILNQFDIPLGAVKEMRDNKPVYEETQWTSAADLAGKRYYFHTYDSRLIRLIDLNKMDPNAKEITTLKVDAPETFTDLSTKLKG